MDHGLGCSKKGERWLFFALLLVLISSLVLSSCGQAALTPDPAVVLADYDRALALYDQLEIGMSYEQANELLGAPTRRETPAQQTPGVPAVPQFPGPVWEFGSGDGVVKITYIVGSRSDSGSKSFHCRCIFPVYSAGAFSTSAQYDAVKPGMTYDQVKEIMGSPGRLMISDENLLPGIPKIVVSPGGITSVPTPGTRFLSQLYLWWPESADGSPNTMGIIFINGLVSESKSYGN
jgi:outer membrane protein assembly factor BamE (lipoprotein component of BamABCDE complex)